MKEHLEQLIRNRTRGTLRDDAGRALAREYLQMRILQILQDRGAFSSWTFLGGTALRVLFALPRYSEDLDFSLVEAGAPLRFPAFIRNLQSTFRAEGYGVDVRIKESGAVNSAWLRFGGLLHDLGISPHQNETLAIRIEIDTNPPPGAVSETTVVRRIVTVRLLHHDRASLLAGKLHAVLMRAYTKGRDLFDLAWYLADPSWPEPNLTLLTAALEQTGWQGPEVAPDNWRDVVCERIEQLDWARAAEDVAPFIERPEDLSLVTLDSCRRLLRAS